MLIYDSSQRKKLFTFPFISTIRNVIMIKDYAAAVIETDVYIFSIKSGSVNVMHNLKTRPNPSGIFSISSFSDGAILCALHTEHKKLSLINYFLKTEAISFQPFDREIQEIKFSFDGNKLATVDENGIYIKIYETLKCTCLHSFRRGLKKSIICCMNFDLDCNFLVVSGSSNTIHIFGLQEILTHSIAKSATEILASKKSKWIDEIKVKH